MPMPSLFEKGAMASSIAPEQFSVAIIGGGVCGVLAAQRCVQENMSFILFDRCTDFGGNWFVRANSYSHLQVCRTKKPWTGLALYSRNQQNPAFNI